jgi:hypothetical protein
VQSVELRVSPATYMILWLCLSVVWVPALVASISGARGFLTFGAAVALAGVVFTVFVARVRLAISPEGVSYRGLTRAMHVPRAEIVAVQASFGERGPWYELSVETSLGAMDREFRVNIKPFRGRDLRRFFVTAAELEIPTRIDALVARLIS